jgi:hypothetical protein
MLLSTAPLGYSPPVVASAVTQRNVLLLVVDDLRTDLEHTTDQHVVTPNLPNLPTTRRP